MRRLRIIGAAGTHLSDVEKALRAAAEGKIRAIIDRTMPLSEAAEAHRIVERNQTLGKIILDPTQDVASYHNAPFNRLGNGGASPVSS
jgi:D-arabinose 1-dehydrogenase-like Zn-dependent alcohol dehydrogenase